MGPQIPSFRTVRTYLHWIRSRYASVYQISIAGGFCGRHLVCESQRLVGPTAQLLQLYNISGTTIEVPRVFKEHLKTCEDTFYSKRKVKLFNKCLHCFLTGNIIGWCSAIDQSLTKFQTLFGKRRILPVKLTEEFACDTHK